MRNHLHMKITLLGSIAINVGMIACVYYLYESKLHELRPMSESVLHSDELPLNKYALKNLHKTIYKPQEISFGPTEEKTDD